MNGTNPRKTGSPYTLKKSLGQHFLHNQQVIRKIIALLPDPPPARLLEVGPGGGALTRHLRELPVDFRAVELDAEKIAYLAATYEGIGDKLIHESVLDMDVPFRENFTIIGNFPYNISTQILFKVLEWKDQVDEVIGMFQKEVAQRIAASPGNKVYGLMSVLMQAWYKIEYCFEISESAFRPPPKVKSAVIRLVPLSRPVVMKSESDFKTLVKAAFNQRRKTLRNATRALFAEEVLQEKIFDRRAEQLSVEEFGELSFKLK